MNDALNAAIEEAYASAPEAEVILNTLELRHPAFSTPIRVVLDNTEFMAYLEADAPVDAGLEVLFSPFKFGFKLPDVSGQGNSELQITIDNVSQEIQDNIELSMDWPDPIELTYRPYLASDPSGPQMDPPLHMTATTIPVNLYTVTLNASFGNLVNKKFPSETYTLERFPGLA